MVSEQLTWVEKYRPKSLNELILNEHTINKLNSIIKSKNIPNMILTGSSGVGKTSTILFIAKEIFGDDYDEAVIELNASDKRGLEIKDDLTDFCKKKICEGNKIKKIVIMDEADNITIKAQNVIGNLMKKYINSTRFVFTCNDATKLIESIHSNSITLQYTKIPNIKLYNRLEKICKKENIKYDKQGIASLVFLAQGDIRVAINNLECVYYSGGSVNEDTVFDMYNKPKLLVVKEILKNCIDGDIKKNNEIINILVENGYSISDVILTMMNFLKDDRCEINEAIKIRFYSILCKTYIRVNEGMIKKIQLLGCIAEMCKKN